MIRFVLFLALALSFTFPASAQSAKREPAKRPAKTAKSQQDSPRTISIYNIHTKETLTVVYKRGGAYVPEAMKQINWIMRDWRRNEPTEMDRALVDLLWETHEELGSKEPIHLISGYRSPKTNSMLRKTRGGQASKSRHMVGKAADVHFPDVPLRQIRYSGLIRERGGVGYYPTSAIPFVHLDIDRVRHWPRLPQHEMALLFPDGKSKQAASAGFQVTPAAVKAAREKYKDLASQVAEYLDIRKGVRKPTLMAGADIKAPAPIPASKPWTATTVASLSPPEPALARGPRLAERPSKLSPGPSAADRVRLGEIIETAALDPNLAPPRMPDLAPGSGPKPGAPSAPPAEGWASAPEYDEEHPGELSYRPFPIAPYLTQTDSPDDPALVSLKHPDLAETLEMIDDEGSAQPMRFRPRQQVARLMWTQHFQGESVGYVELSGEGAAAPAGLVQRSVTTSSR